VIAALYVATGGCYFGIPDVDPWDAARDARQYTGPHPVVAHPPCERWGRYWSGGPSASRRRELGDDAGCFAAALAAVRRDGGVLEHPEASHAFAAHGLARPAWRGGWADAGDGRGHVCCVAQGNYGHRARKLTWLYAVDVELPALDWRIPAPRDRLDQGFHSRAERAASDTRKRIRTEGERLDKPERAATPPAFRDILIAMARSVNSFGWDPPDAARS
jgi:hypothetical protein